MADIPSFRGMTECRCVVPRGRLPSARRCPILKFGKLKPRQAGGPWVDNVSVVPRNDGASNDGTSPVGGAEASSMEGVTWHGRYSVIPRNDGMSLRGSSGPPPFCAACPLGVPSLNFGKLELTARGGPCVDNTLSFRGMAERFRIEGYSVVPRNDGASNDGTSPVGGAEGARRWGLTWQPRRGKNRR